MTLSLYMSGLTVQNMNASLEFYQRLGLVVPKDSQNQPHIEIKMGNMLTFFLDTRTIKEAKRSLVSHLRITRWSLNITYKVNMQ